MRLYAIVTRDLRMGTSNVQIERQARAPKSRRPYRVVDSDVHALSRDGFDSIFPFMPTAWRERFTAKGSRLNVLHQTVRFGHPNAGGVRRDAAPPGGGPGGSDGAYVATELLDGWGVDIAVVSGLQAGAMAAGLAGPDESNVLCRAFNDYFLQQFISADPRLRYLITVNSQDTESAAAEVRRLGSDPRVVGIYLPSVNTLMGNRWFSPVYAAAEEFDLPIFSHISGADYIYLGAPVPTGGFHESYGERRIAFAQIAQSNLTSLIFSGTLERFPKLKVVFAEFGFTWLLPHLWRMDTTWKATRIETPWVKTWPSDYVRGRIRFTTQPIDEPREPKDLDRLVTMLGDDLLLFSTDYPHWDNDSPDRVLATLPADAQERIYSSNPLAFWRL
jgi:predicted TIM-barrel fold metal-dependent hydrolase